MFNLFKKAVSDAVKKTEEYVTLPVINYPSVVEQVHNEFYNAGDALLEKANCLLKDLEQKSVIKGKRLADVGFKNAQEAKTALQILGQISVNKELSDLVMYYKFNYPNNKFITELQVKEICEKYNLICGAIELYNGFVPESKLQDIEEFVVKEKDKHFSVWSKGIHNHYIGQLLNDDGESAKRWNNLYKKVTVFTPLFICAPHTDMDSTGKVVNEYKIEDKKHIPDPVVLQPVNGGYLIVTAWGDEATDEIVINEVNN